MAFADTGLEKIRTALAKGPQLLSYLGGLLSQEERPDRGLRQMLKEHDIKTQRVGHGPKIFAYLEKDTQKMQELCREEASSTPYRNSVLLAFCKKVESDKIIGLRLQPKVEFVEISSKEKPPAEVTVIEDNFRHPDFNVRRLTEDEREKLESSIENWCSQHAVDKKDLLWKKKEPSYSPVVLDIDTFMRSFLEAQPEDIRHRVNFPGIIVEQLLKISH